MLFNSYEFLIFFPIVLFVYHLIPDKIKNVWLLLASYYFYMSWNIKYGILFFAITVFSYLDGRIIGTINDLYKSNTKHSKAILFIGCAGEAGVLFWFKYAEFSLSVIREIFDYFGGGVQVHCSKFDILLPIGISFYIFQTMGYMIDVYRRETIAEKNFCRYALFISFFPQLIAGPIERSSNILYQLQKHTKIDFDMIRRGFLQILWGYFLKIVVADRIGIFVDNVYQSYDTFPGYYLIVASILFAFQIYCDFMGYSVIAVGAAMMLGIKLMDNFNAPYMAGSVSAFWRRWHISLFSWLRDYVYIPLGGSQRGMIRKYINTLITFLLSGFWHGANWTFLAWGVYNGLSIILSDALTPIKEAGVKLFKLHRERFCHRLLCSLGTFAIVDFSWIFFRSNSLTDAKKIITSILTVNNPWILFDGSLYECGLDAANFWFMIFSIGIVILVDFFNNRKCAISDAILKQDYWFRWIFIAGTICAILLFGEWGNEYDAAKFIYFQF